MIVGQELVLNIFDPGISPENEVNKELIHDLYSAVVNEHMQKVPIGDHKTFKTLENEHENHIKSKIRTNFHNNCPCVGQKVTGENALVSDTEPPARGQTKTLGTLTEESPRAQELAENIVKEKGKNVNSNVGKVNPGQKEMNLILNEFRKC